MSDTDTVGYILLQNYKNQGFQPFGGLRSKTTAKESLDLIESRLAPGASSVYALARVSIVPETPAKLPETPWWGVL